MNVHREFTTACDDYRAFLTSNYYFIQISLAGFTNKQVQVKINKTRKTLHINAVSNDKFFGKLHKHAIFDISNKINIDGVIETSFDSAILTIRLPLAMRENNDNLILSI